MKLKNIKIENYRFFKEEQEFNFISKEHIPQNILLYGENGSGKTSLHNALIDFFFYYKNPIESKTKIKENKNIFAEPTDKPKIEVIFENDINIKFTENGFDNENLKTEIEQVSKSKLFLTYQDIYLLNNIFKKELTYNEFRDIFTILYFDHLNDKFINFESLKTKFEKELNQMTNNEILADYNKIYELIEQFDFDTLDNQLMSEIEKNEIKLAYYLPQERFADFQKLFERVINFIEICETLNIEIKNDYWLKNELENISDKLSTLLEQNDRFNIKGFKVLEREDFEQKTILDEFIEELNTYILIVNDYEKIKDLIQNINKIVLDELKNSVDKINFILKFLDVNIFVRNIIEPKDYLFYSINIFKVFSVDLKIELSGKELKNHWSSLNEAKLSALNLAIYFSSVLGKKPNIPILVLDDLLISLDMSNRDKILSLLLDRTLNQAGQPFFFDDDYQMFIFTHDRAFFELAKYRFDSKASGKWKYFEMYENTSESYPQPLILPSENKIEKAESFIKIGDYAAAGNYLRKASEEVIKKKLLDTYLKELDKPTLDPLIKLYKKMLEDFTFDIPKCILELEDLAKRVLNPSSHDDLISPLYKKELEDTLMVVRKINELDEIQIKKIINGGAILLYELENKYKVRFNFLKDVNLFVYDAKIGNRENTYLGNCGYAIYENNDWNDKYYDKFTTFTLKKAFEVVCFSVYKDFSIQIDAEAFISKLKIDNSLLDEEKVKFIRRQII